MSDERLAERLRAARPPIEDTAGPPDLWPSLAARLEERPRWSPLDVGLCAAVAAALMMFPEWLWLLVHHL